MSERYKLYFVPGIHPFTEDQSRSVRASFRSGNLESRNWNPEVTQKLRTYQPYVLGIDSVGANREERFRQLDGVWLPGTPQQISGRDNIYAVVGDVLYSGILRGYSADNPLKSKLDQVEHETVRDYAKKCIAEILVATPFLGALLLLSSINLGTTISRRRFLRGATLTLGAGLLSITAGRFSPLIQTISTDNRWDDFLQTVAGLTKPLLTSSTWLDGRTALLIAKTKEAMETLDLPEEANGAVLMGFPHGYQARTLLSNRDARQEVTLGYAQEMLKNIDRAVEETGIGGKFPIEDISDALLTYFARMDIFNVSEPDPPTTEKVQSTLSEEVAEALSSLGDPYRFFQDELAPPESEEVLSD